MKNTLVKLTNIKRKKENNNNNKKKNNPYKHPQNSSGYSVWKTGQREEGIKMSHLW